jgi:glucosamine-6-phosphate deaminase
MTSFYPTKIDSLEIKIYETDSALGSAAAEHVTHQLLRIIKEKGFANLLLATGTSQLHFLKAFSEGKSLDWSRISVFHLDEYIGITADHPASFRKYLQDRVVDRVKPGKVFLLQGDENDIPGEIDRYEQLLDQHPVDIACIGIGENGHIAFNEPLKSDFNDHKMVRIVELDDVSREQQVKEGWFTDIDQVPRQALTLTIPAIMRSGKISCVVPELRKAIPIKDALYGPISTQCPASILRTHREAVLFLDAGSASVIRK